MTLLGLCALISVAITAIVLVLMPPAHAHHKTGLRLRGVLGDIGHVHMTWFLTVWLDIVLVLLVTAFYAVVSPGLPRYPVPNKGQIFEVLVPIAHVNTGGGRYGWGHTIFGVGYAGWPLFAICWALFANVALLLLASVVGFYRGLGDPLPSGYSEPTSPPIDSD